MSILFFLFGTIIGSFLNVCIFRIPAGESIAFPPSHCGNCKKNLKPIDLVPVLSYLFLGGKCRYCKNKISIRYPLVELLTGFLYFLVYIYYGISFLTVKYIVLITFLIVISLIDYDTQDVYAVTTYPAIILGFVFALVGKFYFGESLTNYILGFAIASLAIFLVSKLTGGAMGSGDIEIHAIAGVFLGWKLAIINIFLSFIIGGLLAVISILFKKKKRGDYIAFGPAIGISTILLIFLGNLIVPIYFGF
ncbi:prepilin peptidase [Clostridium sp. B9]|uniref:prepilin peptidase n=1 Tax=Clostridium sp. B9 TaxID=3423224 RepID=UPI003D2EB1DB